MRNLLILIWSLVLFGIPLLSIAQFRVKIQTRDESEVPLVGATLLLGTGQVRISDSDGNFNFNFAGETSYKISFVGFIPQEGALKISSDTIISITLFSDNILIEEVMISAVNDVDDLQQNTTVFRITSKDLSGLPYLLGEQDPIKFIQTQPGISTGADGNNGYYVRGGGIDQNMIELDRIQLYNTNHLFGFFSMFNGAAVDRIDFVKGGFNAEVGGRLSSSMRIFSVLPDNKDFSGSFGAGLLATNFNLNIPITPQKSAMVVSVRRSYIDLITQNAFDPSSSVRKRTDYRFSDAIFKFQHQLNPKSSLVFSGFVGFDDYQFKSGKYFSNTINWGTYNAGLQWFQILNDDFDFEVYLNAGTYNQYFGAEITTYNMDLSSIIHTGKGGAVFYQGIGNSSLTYGLESIFRKVKPNQVNLINDQKEYSLSDADWLASFESALFLDVDYEISSKLKIGGGLRLSRFDQIGPFIRYLTNEDNVVLDTLQYSRGQLVKSYINPEPRIRVTYLVGESKSLKAAYDRTYQYTHLAPLSSVSLPTDIWVPSSEVIAPQNAHQISLGYFQLLPEQYLKLSAGAFYKLMNRQLEYRNGAIIGYSQTNNFDDVFSFGKGASKGVEVQAQKDQGSAQFQFNYTLSRTTRTFKDISPKPFPSKYDRTHDLNIIGSYRLKNWVFSSLFKVATGSALTLPTAKYLIGGNVISEYTSRNAFRLPTYHRLDVAASWHPKGNDQATLTFSIYNVYNRANPYYIYFEVEGNVQEYKLDIDVEKVSLFPILPAISYERKF